MRTTANFATRITTTTASSGNSRRPPGGRGGRSGRGELLVVLAVALIIAEVLPPGHAIAWLVMRHAPLTGWRSSACRPGSQWGLSARQVSLCRTSLDAMPHLARAAQLAVATCKQLFADRRWDCSSLDTAPRLGPDLYTGTREQAYVYALSSASVAFAVARACSQGALARCSCAGPPRAPPRDPPNGNFKWGGCGDNVRYGTLLARQFADAAERRAPPASPPSVLSSKRRKSVDDDLDQDDDGRAAASWRRRPGRAARAHVALANLHNNRAGRRAVEASEVTQCKCHGVSGSCNIKTCWRAVPRLADVGLRLQRRFASAVEVVARRTAARGRRLVPAPAPAITAGPSAGRHFSQDDLVFMAKSPDYCLPDPRTGSKGTQDRSCNASSSGYDSCKDMCCGRGYKTVTVEKVERCQCKYYWCCYVKCKTCTTLVDIHKCL